MTWSADMPWRLAGAAALLVAAATGFAARPLSSVLSATGQTLALFGFAMACFGLLLLAKGRRLHDAWLATLDTASAHQVTTQPSVEQLRSLVAWEAVNGGRAAIATYLILRAQQHSAPPRRRHSARRPDDPARRGFAKERI